MEKVQSTCNFCAIDCNLDFYVEDGKVVKTVPTPGYPVNNGFCCIKGLSLNDSISHREIMKCNMCVHSSESGTEPRPMCVEKCPMGAISLVEVSA